MGCSSCASGGCGSGNLPNGCGSNGSCTTGGCSKLEVFDWLAGMELPFGQKKFDVIEVKFKNTRKEFYKNISDLDIAVGEPIVVEAASGYDIGIVSLTGELVKVQMQKKNLAPDTKEIKKVLRKPSQKDLDKWKDARSLEHSTMLKTRVITSDLGLLMKVSDIEYQADRTKATFFYTADDRVDFRQLIKVLAERFKIRIEMRQIGARQEAGRLGGIGSCGRELCCSTWLTDFRSVSTSAARYQQLSINPLKLAGQCGKLKCCLNYELDAYVEAFNEFPDTEHPIKTEKGVAFHQKSDIFRGMMWYSYPDVPNKFYPLTIDRVKSIQEMNKEGKKPADLADYQEMDLETEPDYENVVGQDDLTRFDNTNKKRRKGKKLQGGPQNRKGGRPDKKKRPNEQRASQDGKPRRDRDGKPQGKGNNRPNKGGGKPKQSGGNPENRRNNGNNDNRKSAPKRQGNNQGGNSNKPPRNKKQQGGKPKGPQRPKKQNNDK